MAWILGQMAMAVGFATSASGGSDRSTTQIAESRDLIGNVAALLFQGFQRHCRGHRGQPPTLAYCIRTDIVRTKETSHFTTFKSHTRREADLPGGLPFLA